MAAFSTFSVRAAAKLNLFLRVLRLRDDGFHEIQSVFHAVDLCDVVTIEPAADLAVHLVPTEDLVGDPPPPEHDLALKAASSLADVRPLAMGARVTVRKRIPIAAGLGGGSADCAAVLTGLARAWDVAVEADLFHRAASLGSDVPFWFQPASTANVWGRGDKIGWNEWPGTFTWVLGADREPMSTPEVYREWDEVGSTVDAGPTAVLQAVERGDPVELAHLLHNDLERPAFLLRPELARRKQAMLDAGALGAALTGSGPTLAALARDRAHGEEVARRVQDRFDRVFVVATKRPPLEVVDGGGS